VPEQFSCPDPVYDSTSSGRRLLNSCQGSLQIKLASFTGKIKAFLQHGIARTDKTLDNLKGAWIKDQKVDVKDGKIVEYRVAMKVTFVLRDRV